MKYLGYRDEDIPESYTISEAVEKFLEVHPNTVRKWMRSGQLEAVRVHGEIRIQKPSLLAFLAAWRDKMPSAGAVLTVDELNHAGEVIAEIVEVKLEVVDAALEELEECHHLSFSDILATGDREILVHHGPLPDAPLARMVKRMLAPKLCAIRSCPWCSNKLPRFLQAASSLRPRGLWTMGAKPVSTEKSAFIIGYWYHKCSKCGKIAFLLDVPEVERAEGTVEEHNKEARMSKAALKQKVWHWLHDNMDSSRLVVGRTDAMATALGELDGEVHLALNRLSEEGLFEPSSYYIEGTGQFRLVLRPDVDAANIFSRISVRENPPRIIGGISDDELRKRVDAADADMRENLQRLHGIPSKNE